MDHELSPVGSIRMRACPFSGKRQQAIMCEVGFAGEKIQKFISKLTCGAFTINMLLEGLAQSD